jgi:hypothetical protein
VGIEWALHLPSGRLLRLAERGAPPPVGPTSGRTKTAPRRS